MRCTFSYPCRVGVVLPDGCMTSMEFEPGDVIDIVNVGNVNGPDWAPRELELVDGTVLVDVSLAALQPVTTVPT